MSNSPGPEANAAGGVQSHLVSGSAWVMGGFVVNAITGLAFWVLAARTYEPDQVGIASALFASLQFVNYATTLGLPETLSRHHHLDRRLGGALFTWSVIAACVASLIGAWVYLALVESDSGDRLDALGAGGLPLFAVLVAGTALTMLVDVELMADRRWRLVFFRLLVVGSVRLPLVVLPIADSVPLSLLLAVSAPIALSGLIGALAIPRLTGLGSRLQLDRRMRVPLHYAGVNYVSHLAFLAPQFVLPVIVLLNVTAVENANFFIPWSFAVVLSLLPLTISRVLLVESSHDGVSLNQETRRAMLFAVGLMVVALAAGLAGRPVITWVFGPRYEDIVSLLPVLLLGEIPAAVTMVLLAYGRARDDHFSSIAIPSVLAVTTVAFALVTVPRHGAEGAAWAWLVGNSVAATVAVALLARGRVVALARQGADRIPRPR